MERNRDLPRTTVSGVNNFPRRRHRITTQKNSSEDRQMELQETVRLRDRQRLQKKDRDRDFPKRRRVDRIGGAEIYRESEISDSSDEEYYDEEEAAGNGQQNLMNQSSLSATSLPNYRRSLRFSPVLKHAVHGIIGVPVPRRARSTSARKLRRSWNSSSGEFREELSRRRCSPSPIVIASVLPSASGVLLKKKKSVERRTRVLSSAPNSRPPSVSQDDIEIEVAEALFDLMKQSQSQPQSHFSGKSDTLDRDSSKIAHDESKILKAEGNGDERDRFLVQKEQSIIVDAETNMVDSVKGLKKDEKEKFPDNPVQESGSGDWFVKNSTSKRKLVSLKDSDESPSRVKADACEILDPTMRNADGKPDLAEAKYEGNLEIDLMVTRAFPSSPERSTLLDMRADSEVMIEDIRKEEKIVSVKNHKLSNLDLEKHHDDTSYIGDEIKQQLLRGREQKFQSPTACVPFPISMNSWPGVVPQPGFIPPVHAVLPMDGRSRSSMTVQPPQFKFSQPRAKRCATHQCIAHNIDRHQKLINKLWSAPTDTATVYSTKPSNINSMSPKQELFSEMRLLGEFQGAHNLGTNSAGIGIDNKTGVSSPLNATGREKLVLQQGPYQAPASNFLNGSAVILPLDHHEATTMASAIPSGPHQSDSAVGNASLASHSAGGSSVNSNFPGKAAAFFNPQNPPPNKTFPYMAMLQNGGSPIPISTSVTVPHSKGGKQAPAMPFFDPSFYSSPVFNISCCQQQLSLPHSLVQSVSQNTKTPDASPSNKQPLGQKQSNIKPSGINKQNTLAHSCNKSESVASLTDALTSQTMISNTGQICSFAVPPLNFSYSNKHVNPHQHGSKDGAELIPQAFALPFSPNSSTNPPLHFSSLAQTPAIFQMPPHMAQNGHRMAALFQTAQQKYFEACERKSANVGVTSIPGNSGSTDVLTVSSHETSTAGSIVEGVNFVPSVLSGKQPFPSSSTAVSSCVSATITNLQQLQQQQLIQLQKHHHLQQVQRGATSSFPSNNQLFAQVAVQSDNLSHSSQLENFPRTPATNDVSQQLKNSLGQKHISFENSSVSNAASLQGQQIVINS